MKNGKVRYVGGFCLAKLRYKHQKIQFDKCYKTSSKDQAQYKKLSVYFASFSFNTNVLTATVN
jgi:hypothetical protein